MDIRNVVIMGSGCAGHTAALYSARANLKPLVIEGHEPGGQLSMTTLVENFPGFPEGIQGPELIENMRKQAERFGAEYRIGHLVKADLSRHPIELTIGKETIQTRTLLIASGASARWLGLPNEHALIGHGVSSCATCDGFFFSGKEIAVIGGGDSAMEEATFLTRFASKVTLIHRREQFRASKIMLDRARANPKIAFLTDTVVDDVLDVSKKEVTGLRLRNLKSGESWELPASAMFLGIGHIPMATWSRIRTSSRKCRAYSRAATCRIAATAKRSPPLVPAAWPRSKWRNFWKKKDTEGCTSRSFRITDDWHIQPLKGYLISDGLRYR
jgi:thioredoxin reductase (NADPH)